MRLASAPVLDGQQGRGHSGFGPLTLGDGELATDNVYPVDEESAEMIMDIPRYELVEIKDATVKKEKLYSAPRLRCPKMEASITQPLKAEQVNFKKSPYPGLSRYPPLKKKLIFELKRLST